MYRLKSAPFCSAKIVGTTDYLPKLDQRIIGVKGLLNLSSKTSSMMLDKGVQDSFLTIEVVVQSSDGNPRSLRDIRHFCGLITVSQNYSFGGRKYGLTVCRTSVFLKGLTKDSWPSLRDASDGSPSHDIERRFTRT